MVAAGANLEVPYSAREVVVEFEDEQSDLRANSLQVVVNGRTVATNDESDVRTAVRGNSVRVRVRANGGTPIDPAVDLLNSRLSIRPRAW